MSLEQLAHQGAFDHGLPDWIVDGVITVESSWNPWAYNPEQKYRWFWNVKTDEPFRAVTAAEINNEYAPRDFPRLAGDNDNEWWAQQASWGLMQVMGAVARERGFKGDYLTELCDPAIGIQYGCAHLVWLKNKLYAKYGWQGVLSAYNSGSPDSNDGLTYATKVMNAKK